MGVVSARAAVAIGFAVAEIVSPASAFARAELVVRWRPYASEASLRFGIPLAWIERVMRAESGGRTRIDGCPVVSRAGAMGLMQLMPGTWAEMRRTLGLGDDPHDPRDNIFAGTAYLRAMYDRFGYPGLFAAYNAGPARYAAYLHRRATLPGETRAYLVAVTGRAAAELPGPDRAREHRASSLFVRISRAAEAPASLETEGSSSGLFVRLSSR